MTNQGGAGEGSDPIALFQKWYGEARENESGDASAVALATVDADGRPNARMVLLKGADAAGFVFYTNLESAKGQELAAHADAALCFHWKSLRRQVRVRGPVTPVSDEEADAYFATRPKDSQIGAWASAQSRAMEGRFVFERQIGGHTQIWSMLADGTEQHQLTHTGNNYMPNWSWK